MQIWLCRANSGSFQTLGLAKRRNTARDTSSHFPDMGFHRDSAIIYAYLFGTNNTLYKLLNIVISHLLFQFYRSRDEDDRC